ncbi:MAG: DUF4416 family protein [Thermodesulfobacteriota bacterium]
MRTLREPLPALMVLSVLSADWGPWWPDIRNELAPVFGECDFVSELLDFSHTPYYDSELGTPLARRILAFRDLAPQERLADLKLETVRLELAHARPDGTRRMNLDPGLLTQERLVLASGKNFPHRVYLGRGIYADLTLVYTRSGWQNQPWTFPDYASPQMHALFSVLRERYRDRLAELGLLRRR